MKELTESPPVSAFRARFEAGRSFDLDDDLEFCPGLLTEDDVSRPNRTFVAPRHLDEISSSWRGDETGHVADHGVDVQLQSIHSSSSDGSLSSGSPHSSPLQQQIQPAQQVTPTFSLASSSANGSYNAINGYPSNTTHHQQMKILQPSALRPRNAIPIVNPSTGKSLASPPPSISPATAMMHQRTYGQRW
ncbi:hypothetical protein MMC07_004562 [Pseudocyphellaria aurata]|nr:hypothetical protein [Pseudocyphellaria aurata]